MKKNAFTRLVLAVAFLGCQEEAVELPPYQLVTLETRNISVSASAAGVIEPIQTVEVKSKASGEILQVPAQTGDVVTPGQVLVRVDPRVPRNALIQAEADLEVARAQLANAESQLNRSQALFETQSITEQEFETARLQHAQANAQLIRAERSVEDATIAFEDTEVRAAISGMILSRNVEVGTVITSATSNVGGGAVLMTMANLDTVQIRALVDETDIGKISPGMNVSINVDAYPNQRFDGRVLKIEPQAVEQQNVTMFPVLVRIPNSQSLLRPGMNAEVEVSVGNRRNVLAVPYAALRTQRDVASAAGVLGLNMQTVQEQLAAARGEGDNDTDGPMASNGGGELTLRMFDGREIPLPEGTDPEVARSLQTKIDNRDFQSMTPDERALMQRLRSQLGGGDGSGGGRQTGRPGGEAGGRRGARGGGGAVNQQIVGGEFIVFALRGGRPTAVPVRTGLTDLDFAEVISGLTPEDTVLLLPSASLIAEQQQFQDRVQRFSGGGIPGVRSR